VSWENGVLLFGVTDDPAEERLLSFRRFRESVNYKTEERKAAKHILLKRYLSNLFGFQSIQEFALISMAKKKTTKNRLQHP